MRYPVRLPDAADVGASTSPLAFRCSMVTSFHVPTNRSVGADRADAFAAAWPVGALPSAAEDGRSAAHTTAARVSPHTSIRAFMTASLHVGDRRSTIQTPSDF